MSKQPAKRAIRVLCLMDAGTTATGFGCVARNILYELATDKSLNLDIDQIGINFTGDYYDVAKFPYRIYPALNPMINPDYRDLFGRPRIINALLGKDPAMPAPYDILFTLQDPFILEGMVEGVKQCKQAYGKQGLNFKWISYWPADGGYKENWADTVCASDYPAMYTNYAKGEVIKALNPTKRTEAQGKVKVIYHGTNTKDFHPVGDKEKKSFRDSYFVHDGKPLLKDNTYLVTNVNRNQARKDIIRSMKAFREFKKMRPDSILYLHMKNQDAGGSIREMARRLNMVEFEDFILPQGFNEAIGVPISALNLIYNATDLLITTSLGEGWGLCLSPETITYTNNGVKKLKEICISDSVYSADGKFKNVLGIKKRKYTGKLFTVLTWKGNKIYASDNHPFYVAGKGYIQAKDLTVGDKTVFPRLNLSKDTNLDIYEYLEPSLNSRQLKYLNLGDKTINIQSNFKGSERKIRRNIDLSNKDISWLLGIYVAEGCSSLHKGQIKFSFNSDEKEYLKKVERILRENFCNDLVFSLTNKKGFKSTTLNCTSSILAALFKRLFGDSARSKKIDFSILNKVNAEYFLKGLIEGDGHVTKHEITISTASRDLAYSIRLLCSQIGIICGVEQSRIEYKIRISGKTRNKLLKILNKDICDINEKYSNEKCEVQEDYIVSPIKQIDEEDVIDYELIDIEVEDTHSFVAENCLVHNSITEAMSTKTPVIAPNHTSIPEILGEGRGIIADTKGWFSMGAHDMEQLRPLTDEVDMTAKMIWAYDNPNECKTIADNAYKWVIKLKWSKVCEQWKDVFKEAIKDLEAYYEQNRAKRENVPAQKISK